MKIKLNNVRLLYAAALFEPQRGPNGEGEDNTGTSHGGVYLHAPYGNNSKQVTFYYN